MIFNEYIHKLLLHICNSVMQMVFRFVPITQLTINVCHADSKLPSCAYLQVFAVKVTKTPVGVHRQDHERKTNPLTSG